MSDSPRAKLSRLADWCRANPTPDPDSAKARLLAVVAQLEGTVDPDPLTQPREAAKWGQVLSRYLEVAQRSIFGTEWPDWFLAGENLLPTGAPV